MISSNNDECDNYDVDNHTMLARMSRELTKLSRSMVSLTSLILKPKETKRQKLASERFSKLSPFYPSLSSTLSLYFMIFSHGNCDQPLIDALKSFVIFASH